LRVRHSCCVLPCLLLLLRLSSALFARPHPSFSFLTLWSSVLPLPLPSFPTRRSSDLTQRLRTSSPRSNRSRSTRATWWNATCSTDRKSTRLNSSHVSISYAVFCLKKKKCQTNGVGFTTRCPESHDGTASGRGADPHER